MKHILEKKRPSLNRIVGQHRSKVSCTRNNGCRSGLLLWPGVVLGEGQGATVPSRGWSIPLPLSSPGKIMASSESTRVKNIWNIWGTQRCIWIIWEIYFVSSLSRRIVPCLANASANPGCDMLRRDSEQRWSSGHHMWLSGPYDFNEPVGNTSFASAKFHGKRLIRVIFSLFVLYILSFPDMTFPPSKAFWCVRQKPQFGWVIEWALFMGQINNHIVVYSVVHGWLEHLWV